jgi:OFA family oxalate/formate antiporter-like MFS transporter
MARLAGTIKDMTGSLDWAYWISAIILVLGVLVCRATSRPVLESERR